MWAWLENPARRATVVRQSRIAQQLADAGDPPGEDELVRRLARGAAEGAGEVGGAQLSLLRQILHRDPAVEAGFDVVDDPTEPEGESAIRARDDAPSSISDRARTIIALPSAAMYPRSGRGSSINDRRTSAARACTP